MIPMEEARGLILSACQPLAGVDVELGEALGCVTAADVFADHDVPLFANTAMDGYAVRSADTTGAPVRLDVVGTIAAGSPPDLPTADGGIGPGQAARIMTGAPLPAGADAVVMVERTVALDGGSAVEVGVVVEPGQHVRRPGEDMAAGQLAFGAGTEVTPGHIGVLASLGLARAHVHRRARVGVLSTGDELVEAGVALGPGQIRDSNRPMLLALAKQAGAEAVDLGTVDDDESRITAAVADAVATCDLVLTSGGVSVGDFDYVKAVLARLGRFHSWQVAIRPAKPLAFAVAAGTPVIGLAGNPVSALVGFELFARPALRRLMGHADGALRPATPAVAEGDMRRSPDGKLHLVRVVARAGDDGRIIVRPAGGQGSHQLRTMVLANALALLPDGPGVAAGERVEVLLMGWPPAGL